MFTSSLSLLPRGLSPALSKKDIFPSFISQATRMSTSVGCCPPTSWGELKVDKDYKAKGVVEKVGDIDVYKVGDGPRCVIWNYDVYGFDGGRTRQFCDQLAEKGEKGLEDCL